jgi:hypothetical protein
MLEQWHVITINESASLQLTEIRGGKFMKIMEILAKARDFLLYNSYAIDRAMQRFLKYADIEFDLIALTVFILDNEKSLNTKKLIELLTFYRPKVDTEIIKQVVALEKRKIIGGVVIRNILASGPVVERKTGYWKKQLNKMSDGRYMVEVYWFEYLYEMDRDDYYLAWFDTEEEATAIYEQLTSLEKVKKLLPKSPYGYGQVDPDWPVQVY